MNQKNYFVPRGARGRAVIGIREKAKKEIAAIESRDLSDEEKVSKIKQIEDSRDEQINKLEDPHILWGQT